MPSPVPHAHLLWQLTRREITGRYKGSVLGLAWSFVTPLFLLAVYTLVFSVVFQARFGAETGSRLDFAIHLFAGLIVYNLFAEVANRAPGLVLANANYVKKVVFPLEILPLVAFGAAAFHALASVCILLIFVAVAHGGVPLTALLWPLVLVPFAALLLGVAWLLASAGVYLRDTGQVVGLLTLALLFLSPVFYPVSALPEALRPLFMLNPLSFVITETRGVLVEGRLPEWSGLALYTALSALVAILGLAAFRKARRGFADVV